MQPRERFIAALERRPITGRVPHFELVFYLTMEALGKVHPTHRSFGQWGQMEEKERQLQIDDIAETYIATAEKYEHSAILLHGAPGNDGIVRMIDAIREKSGDKYFLMLHGDATTGIPGGGAMTEFAMQIAEDPDSIKAQSEKRVDAAIANAEDLKASTSLDGFALCADYCLNDGPFLSPTMFGDFVTPYLARLTRAYRDMGYYVIKHTDGNIMPILDQLVQTEPHGLHSIDPQAGIDIAEVKRLYGDRLCLVGNVNCGLMQTGTEEEVIESTRYALQSGMPGGGYIFSTSNCIYTGMPLSRYDLILDIWRNEGNYPEA